MIKEIRLGNEARNTLIPLLIIFFCIIIIPQALATPNIIFLDGQITQGQNITITGSGFGTRGDYNNLNDTWNGTRFLNFRFKDFEDGLFESDGFIELDSDGHTLFPSGGHTGRYGNLVGNGPSDPVWLYTFHSNQITGVFFSSFWFMVPENNAGGKFARLYMGDGQTQFSLYTGCGDYYLRGGNGCRHDSSGTQWNSTNTFQPRTWHRVEIFVHAADNDLDVTTWMDGVLQWDKQNWCFEDFTYSPEAHPWHLANLITSPNDGYCPTHPSWAGSFNYDDIYYDYTQARIEIGNAPTWSESTHREVQLPSVWSDGSITFTLNKGSFVDGQQAYLYVVDENGVVNEQGFHITFDGQLFSPVADFISAQNVISNVPFKVNFADRSTNNPDSWFWTLGDGKNSTSKYPSHTYTDVGVYTVTLIVTNAAGSDSKTKTDYITVLPNNPPVIAPIGNKTIHELETLSFLVLASDEDSDDNLVLSYANLPSNSTYIRVYRRGNFTWTPNNSQSGVYANINFSVKDDANASDYEVITITVLEPESISPVAGFSANTTTGTIPLSVHFIDESTNFPTSWLWDFGDGNTSIAQNPSHIYNLTGNYSVSLTVTNAVGSDSITKTNYIIVTRGSACPSHDTNPQDDKITTIEIATALNDWMTGSLNMQNLIQLMMYFKRGTCT